MNDKWLSVTETAKLMRDALRSAFPGVRFSVRSDFYAGGASIRVRWTDGPTLAAVDRVVKVYEGATFDGMRDIKEYHEPTLVSFGGADPIAVRFGADFVFTDRDLSPEYVAQLIPHAQHVLDSNEDTAGQTFDRNCNQYLTLGTEHGTFIGFAGFELVRFLSHHIAPASTVAR